MNSVGGVVGAAATAIQPGHSHAFYWDSQTGMSDLGTLGGDNSAAMGVNDAGTVVGWSSTTNPVDPLHAFVWQSQSGIVDLGDPLGHGSLAFDVNNHGQVIGLSAGSASTDVVVWNPDGSYVDLPGTQPWINATLQLAAYQNDAGQVTGQLVTPDGNAHAFLWDSQNGIVDLGTLGRTCSFGMQRRAWSISESTPRRSAHST